ncbi:MAG: DUF4810 domain-containing protein [bacterium]|jgi:hypothetical protein|nr:DUF4810 domain-containing protein [bacterium]
MNRQYLISALVVALLSSSCGPTSIYNYGRYSTTLYKYHKNDDADNLQAHMDELNRLILLAQRSGKRVPPGMHGELGYFYTLQQDLPSAEQHFRTEMQLYPESQIFMQRMLDSIKDSQEGKNLE